MKLSVVVCVRNEESRLHDCLESVFQNHPDEVVLVDGGSTDKTLEVARRFPAVKVIESWNSSLPRDRQKGIDACRNELIAMVDADHRLRPDDLQSLLRDMEEFKFDVVQSGLLAYEPAGFWCSAENASWELVQNVPGRRDMVGVAPAIYNKRVFDLVRFDDHITSTIEDTDFSYRLSKVDGLRFGVGRTKIYQYHFADFRTYVKKFMWYGKGDGEFCLKHPERAPSMLFHLLVRYPVLHSYRAINKGQPKAVPFFILQGMLRFAGLARFFLTRKAIKQPA